MFKHYTLLLFGLVLLMASCEKPAGEGGTSAIYGKAYAEVYNEAGTEIVSQYYAADEDVFIIYGGENGTYDDKFATSHDGSFRFENLTIGTYTLFIYSRCLDGCDSGYDIVEKKIEITENKSENNIGDIVFNR
ncbi:MAG: hypothetical protein MI810_15100 [Flavobacteriales bacterium]|nr:hypothetical protein [Flavobacteriales bacterium]